MTRLEDILAKVRGEIDAACLRSGRDPAEVEIVAVTKTHGPEVVREAMDAGLSIVGENKVQEAAWKRSESCSGAEWHLIGHLQTNKVRQALLTFDFIHSVDSIKLIRKLSTVAAELGVQPHILLEVNVSGEKSKSGLKPSELPEAVAAVLECGNFWLEGLMTMAPFSENPEDSRGYFRRLRELRDETEKAFAISLPRLSMGMSGDYVVAVEEGATYLRLGTVLFGERPKLKRVTSASDGDLPVGGYDSFSGEGETYKIMD